MQTSHFSCQYSQGHQNLINSCPCNNNRDVQVWSKSTHSVRRHGILQQSKPSCDLENGVKVPKSNQMYKFGQNPSIPSWEMVQTSHFPTIWALLWPWKYGQGHQNLINYFPCHSNINVQVWSKIHQFHQETGCRQASFQQYKPSCDLKNGIKVTKILSVLLHALAI